MAVPASARLAGPHLVELKTIHESTSAGWWSVSGAPGRPLRPAVETPQQVLYKRSAATADATNIASDTATGDDDEDEDADDDENAGATETNSEEVTEQSADAKGASSATEDTGSDETQSDEEKTV